MQYHPTIGGNRKITAEKAVHEYLYCITIPCQRFHTLPNTT